MAMKPKSSAPPATPARAKTRAQPPKPAPERPTADPSNNLLTKLEAVEKALSGLQPLAAQMQALASQLERLQATLSDQTRAPTKANPAAPAKSRRATPPPNDDASGRDPGDAVPPGVAVGQPAPVAGKDKKVLDALETLPKRRSRRTTK